MTCKMCLNYDGPRSNYESLGINEIRHAELFRCKNCGQLLEIVAEARAPRFLSAQEAKEYYPGSINETDEP